MRRILLLLALVSAQADAHWQYTKWGMTPEQVTKAAPGKIARSLSQYDPPGTLETDYTASGLPANVKFEFDASGNRLSSVVIEVLAIKSCDRFTEDTRAVYGKPESEVSREGLRYQARWRDITRGNIVDIDTIWFSGTAVSCNITYTPIKSGADTGL